MSNKKKEVVVQRIEKAINEINEKKNKWYFFVVDSKNVPNGSMSYIYQMALSMKERGYDVTMIYQIDKEYTEKEIEELTKEGKPIDQSRVFTGVGEWLGQEYANLPHMNIQKEQWVVAPSDFLFIPEAFSSLMRQTYKHNIPCKRFVILQNYDYVSEFIPFGDQWASYGICDVIASTQKQADLIHSIFPYTRCQVLNPYIKECFSKPIKPQNLVVNIVSKKQSDVNRIIKPFYWKHPWLQFVTFRDLRGYSQSEYSDMLKDGAIMVWVDDETPFGYAPLEAMRCNNIVIGKVPQDIPEWMIKDDTLRDNGIWFNNINDVPSILENVISSWMNDEIPVELTDAMEETNKMYTKEQWDMNLTELVDGIIRNRVNELENIKAVALSDNKDNNMEG